MAQSDLQAGRAKLHKLWTIRSLVPRGYVESVKLEETFKLFIYLFPSVTATTRVMTIKICPVVDVIVGALESRYVAVAALLQ